jgi:hypothetical protein
MTNSSRDCDELKCDLLAPLVTKHGWGSPIEKDSLISYAPIPSHWEGDAKDAFEDLRRKLFILNYQNRGIQIDPSKQGKLATYLESVCGWDPITIDRRLKHYEGYRDRT